MADIHALKRICVVLGCLLFLISFISPFYHDRVLTLYGRESTYYWSYEYDYHYSVELHVGSSQQWFSDYWFNTYLPAGLRIPWILVPMFTIQVLTLLFGVASFIFNRRILSFAPFLLSLLTIALMVYTSMMPSGYPEEAYSGEYELGFYLVLPSLVLFLSAFVLNEMTKKRQTRLTGDSSISTTGNTHHTSLYVNDRQIL